MLRWRVGEVTITSVAEMEAPVPAGALLVGATEAEAHVHEWARPWAVDDAGQLVLRIQALVVEAPGRRIVVDTCVGNDKDRAVPFFHRMQGPFLDDLAAAGCPAETVDTVVCTHLHVDHVGWNTRLVDGRWVPTFPNARYLMVREEVAHWEREPQDDDLFGDSVRPVLDAGLADLVEPGHEVADGITLLPTPGHTPGHVSVRIRSRGEEAVVSGDVMHHPVQCARPEWGAVFDSDAAWAERTRREFLDRYADTDVLVIGTHFPDPVAGHVRRDGDTYRFDV
jgi:glyoxylase-like metal-dependent hydrolase (beta-lactamase superfamily II)